MSVFVQLLLGSTLTRLVFFPALASLPLALMRRASDKTVKLYALTVAVIELAMAWPLTLGRITEGGFARLTEPGDVLMWIGRLGIRYELYIDGIAMPLVALTVLLLPVILLGSWKGIEEHWRGYAASMLLLTTGILGALLARDLFLFYIFWEVMLVPMYLIIGIWGGDRRIYAAVKFFLFTMAGSLMMLIGIIWMGFKYHAVAGRLELPLRRADAPRHPGGAATLALRRLRSRFRHQECRCSRSTPGCRTPTSKRRRVARSCWRAFC